MMPERGRIIFPLDLSAEKATDPGDSDPHRRHIDPDLPPIIQNNPGMGEFVKGHFKRWPPEKVNQWACFLLQLILDETIPEGELKALFVAHKPDRVIIPEAWWRIRMAQKGAAEREGAARASPAKGNRVDGTAEKHQPAGVIKRR